MTFTRAFSRVSATLANNLPTTETQHHFISVIYVKQIITSVLITVFQANTELASCLFGLVFHHVKE